MVPGSTTVTAPAPADYTEIVPTDTKRFLRDGLVLVLPLLILAVAVAVRGRKTTAPEVFDFIQAVTSLLVGGALCWVTIWPLLDRRARTDLWPLAEGTVAAYELTRGVSLWWWFRLPSYGSCRLVLQLPGRQVRVVVREMQDIRVARPAGLRLKDVYPIGDALILAEAERRLAIGRTFPVRVSPATSPSSSLPEVVALSEARAPSRHVLGPLLTGLLLLGLGGLELSTFIRSAIP